MTEKRECPVCGKGFDIPATRKKQKYCSYDCSMIGQKLSKEEEGKKRVDKFIDELLDMEILDVLPGNLERNATNNRMTVKGARTWESPDVEYVVLVVKK